MTQRRARITRLAAVAAACLGVGAVVVVGTSIPPFSVPAAHAALGAGGEYHPVTPARVLDTRVANSPAAGAHRFLQPFDVLLAGANALDGTPSGIPASGVLAVVANITVVDPQQPGFLTAYPSGTSMPLAANVNFAPGRNVPNLSLMRPGTNGAVSIALGPGHATGTAHVVIDVVGWFSTSSSGERGARLVSLAPGRILDTRNGTGRLGALTQGESMRLQIRGADAVGPERPDYVPDTTDVTGVLLNVAATEPTLPTHISVVPDQPVGSPSTASLNVSAGQTKANLVMAPVGADGAVHLYNNSGAVHLVIDVVGYFRTGVNDESRAGRIIPLSSPFRVLDTREPNFGSARLGPAQQEIWNFRPFVENVLSAGIWVGEQDAVIMNFTATDLTFPYPAGNATHMTLYPGGTTLPLAANINLLVNENVPNLVVARLSDDDRLSVYNNSGFIHYVADVAAVVLQD
ncbi:MAG: hypothetical protein AB7J47_02245 [Acidimicrobiia bacterium]